MNVREVPPQRDVRLLYADNRLKCWERAGNQGRRPSGAVKIQQYYHDYVFGAAYKMPRRDEAAADRSVCWRCADCGSEPDDILADRCKRCGSEQPWEYR